MRILLCLLLALPATTWCADTVDDALRWFAKHQSEKGRWDAATYSANCPDDPKCEPGAAATDDVGDIALTSTVVLAYLGAGYDHRMPSNFRSTLTKSLDWLISRQGADGRFAAGNWQHARATAAITEAYAMSSVPALKGPAQRGVAIILADQKHAHGKAYGWDVASADTNNDTWVTACNVMALKSAQGASLDIGDGLSGAKNWLEEAWQAANPGLKDVDIYVSESRFPSSFDCDTGVVGFPAMTGDVMPLADPTCAGAVCAVFLGRHAGDPLLETLANQVIAHRLPPSCHAPADLYLGTIAIFQCGGERWQRWNGSVRPMSVAAQRQGDGCIGGSWDPPDKLPAGAVVGRVMTTAYICLSLECYYCYDPIPVRGNSNP